MNKLNPRMCAMNGCRVVFQPVDEDQFLCPDKAHKPGTFYFQDELTNCKDIDCNVMMYGRSNSFCCDAHWRRHFGKAPKLKRRGLGKKTGPNDYPTKQLKRIKFEDRCPIAIDAIQQAEPEKVARLVNDILSGDSDYVTL